LQCLKLQYEKPLLNNAFNLNLRRYIKIVASFAGKPPPAPAPEPGSTEQSAVDGGWFQPRSSDPIAALEAADSVGPARYYSTPRWLPFN